MPDGGLLGIPAKIAASYKKGQAAGDQALGNGDDDPNAVPGTRSAPGAQGGAPSGGGGGGGVDSGEGWVSPMFGPDYHEDSDGVRTYGAEGQAKWNRLGVGPPNDGITGEHGYSGSWPSPGSGGGGDDVPDPAAGGGGYNPMAGWFNRGGGGCAGGNCG